MCALGPVLQQPAVYQVLLPLTAREHAKDSHNLARQRQPQTLEGSTPRIRWQDDCSAHFMRVTDAGVFDSGVAKSPPDYRNMLKPN